MKDTHFKLSNSFTSLFAQKGSQNPNAKESSSGQSLDKGLFKLNPQAGNTLSDLPVGTLRRRSQEKLESLKDDRGDKKWSIFQQNLEPKEAPKDKKIQPKKYAIDTHSQANPHAPSNPSQPQPQLPPNIVRPSRLQHTHYTSSTQTNSIHSYTLFQTPILPCFKSEFESQPQPEYKCIGEKEGVWKIGKIKVRGDKAVLVIGGIEFEARRAPVAGRAGLVAEDRYYQLPHWRDIWVVQPSQGLFQ